MGKAKAILYFISQGYDVFTEFEGKSPFDFIVHKENVLKRVEVKTTKTKSRNKNGWVFQLKRVRPNKTQTKIYKFSNNQCDILALYVQPIDVLLIKISSDIKATSGLTISNQETERWQSGRLHLT
jgi:Holliday junction resolvase-like predicted endonuclease